MSTPRGSAPEPQPGPRASDDDRQVVVARLRDAAGNGQIDLDELEERIAATYRARTLPELVPITADLAPVAPASAPSSIPRPGERPRALDSASFRGHLTTYCMVIGFLVLIWMLGGFGHPWPLYPAAGWGIGLASHWQGVVYHQERQAEKDARRSQGRSDRDARREARRHRHDDRDRPRGVPPAPPVPPAPAVPPAAAPGPATLAGGRIGSSRRFVVAEFIDVVGSTALNEALGDEGWVQVRERFRDLVDDCVRDAGGFEANTAGDGVLVRFDQPNQAVRCAVEILRRLDVQRGQTGFAPSVRIGIHSGDAVEDGDDIIGAVVNLASRVTGAAEADEILCTEHVADHLDGSWTTRGRGLHTLKGIARPRHLLSVDWR